MSLLEMRGVRRTYRRGSETVEALRGVDLAVEPASLAVVLGASGSGKTTLLHIAAGVDRPTAGEVRFQGRRVDALPEAGLTELRRRHVGMIFQDFHLVPGLTALENVRLPLLFSGGRVSGRALEMMEKAEIAGRRDFYPRQLSGGEQQRVAIARALINGPSLLLADEPTGNLDSEQSSRIVDLFRALALSTGLAVLIATHDTELARRADRVWRLRDGVLGPAGQVPR
ncbi:MAG TPA: ABC transporter ATP-binding protein [Candidatus Polarisedimenticolia bacterium]|nr:ABC transporter ATP-binding protein [Candidatus Polarisedimenticolia bacterium]